MFGLLIYPKGYPLSANTLTRLDVSNVTKRSHTVSVAKDLAVFVMVMTSPTQVALILPADQARQGIITSHRRASTLTNAWNARMGRVKIVCQPAKTCLINSVLTVFLPQHKCLPHLTFTVTAKSKSSTVTQHELLADNLK
jgi:hypothetical protein